MAFCGYRNHVDLRICLFGFSAATLLLTVAACAHRSPQWQTPEEGPPIPGALNDTTAVLQAVVALGGGPDSVAEARSRAQYKDLDEEFCQIFDQDCTQPEPSTTWYAVPTPTVRKLASLRGIPLVESSTPPVPACPMRPKRSEPNALVGQSVGYQVRAGLRFESPAVALVATETRCVTPPWWPEGDMLLNGNGYRVEYRNGSWRAQWQSHVF